MPGLLSPVRKGRAGLTRARPQGLDDFMRVSEAHDRHHWLRHLPRCAANFRIIPITFHDASSFNALDERWLRPSSMMATQGGTVYG